MTLRSGTATRLTVYLHVDARGRHRSMSEEIIRRAHDDGLAGASRFPGIQGFGRSRVIHDDIDPDIVRDLPCRVEVVDPSEQRVRAFAVRLGEVLDHGIAVMETVEVAAVFSERSEEPGS